MVGLAGLRQRRGSRLFLLLDRGCNTAGHGAFAALATVELHRVSRLAFDDRDFAATFATRMLGADGERLFMPFARGPDPLRIADHHGFAAFALHGDGIVRANCLGLGECRDGLGRLPMLDTGTGEGERSKRSERRSRDEETE